MKGDSTIEGIVGTSGGVMVSAGKVSSSASPLLIVLPLILIVFPAAPRSSIDPPPTLISMSESVVKTS